MDVHAPHEPVHTWKDFAIHLAIVTIGLFIALMLEAGVEHLHNRHLLHQAEANLDAELVDNRKILAADEKQVDGVAKEIAANIAVLETMKAHREPAGDMDFRWQWNGMQTAAWDTARATGAVALMRYDAAQGYSVIYTQQAVVNDQALVAIHDLYRSGVSARQRKLSELEAADIDKMIANSQETLSDLSYLKDLCRSLDLVYARSRVER
jgi:hypothetical protein